MFTYIYIYIYIYIHDTYRRAGRRERAANLRTKILEFRGFYSSTVVILRGGILMSMGNLAESLGQVITTTTTTTTTTNHNYNNNNNINNNKTNYYNNINVTIT